jgi:hypothetical protein
MTVQAHPERPFVAVQDDLVADLVTSLRPRLTSVPEEGLLELVRTALNELGEVRVTTYLPILVERRLRDVIAERQPADH